MNPKDLIAQKTAVFGMTRTGKSNTVKIISKTIYQLRQKTNQRIGQLIFDANGEYANDKSRCDEWGFDGMTSIFPFGSWL